MRCKVGDIAVIVAQPHQEPRALGAFVKVLRPSVPNSYSKYGLATKVATWWVESSSPLETHLHGACAEFVVPDPFLRPIRPNEGDDETLTWAGKPQETPADVIRELTEKA